MQRPDVLLFRTPLRSKDDVSGQGGKGSGRRKEQSSGEKKYTRAQMNAFRDLFSFRAKYGVNPGLQWPNEAFTEWNKLKRRFAKLGLPWNPGMLNNDQGPEEPPLVGGGRGPRHGGPGEGAGKTANIPKDPHKPFPDQGAEALVPAGRRKDDDK